MEPNFLNFTVMFIIGTIGMLALAGAIIFFVVYYQKKMLESRLAQKQIESDFQKKMLLVSMESQESERKRLAGDLHDSIGVMLSTIRVNLAKLIRSNPPNSSDIRNATDMLDNTIESVRRISRDLMPLTLERFGISYALNELCDIYTRVAGIQIRFEEEGTPRPIDKKQEVMIFRIVQEFANNSMKHASPTIITITLKWEEQLIIMLQDNGTGFDLEQMRLEGKGIGLFNMENRARMLNATLKLDSKPGHGTLAVIIFKLTDE